MQSDSRPRRSRAIGSHAVVITTRCANQYSKRRADHGNNDEVDDAEKLRIFVRRGSRRWEGRGAAATNQSCEIVMSVKVAAAFT